jgi:hypothetical protein
LRSRIRGIVTGAALALLTFSPIAAAASSPPPVAEVDAEARASGNRKDIAIKIGDAIFATVWPAQVSQISANQLDDHLIVGIRIWGVKFHQAITRKQYITEVLALVHKAFAVEPSIEEIDLWTSVPIAVGQGVIVNGDLAKPTSRVVYSISIRRGEGSAALAARAAGTQGVFWDEEWARSAFKH